MAGGRRIDHLRSAETAGFRKIAGAMRAYGLVRTVGTSGGRALKFGRGGRGVGCDGAWKL